jgi:hypothetical protein
MNTLPTFTCPLPRLTVTWVVLRPALEKVSTAVPFARARYGVKGKYNVKVPPLDELKFVTACLQIAPVALS